MKPSPVVIVLVRDPNGFGPALAGGLQPGQNSSVKREEKSVELSLEKYGIKDCKDKDRFLNVIQFVDSNGSAKVSIFLMPNYKPPIAACAVKEILSLITSEKCSYPPALLIPFITRTMKLNDDKSSQTACSNRTMIYGAEVGSGTDFTQSLLAGTAKAPSSLSIHNEPLACLLEMVSVINLPTVLLTTSASQNETKGASGTEVEASLDLGQFVASRFGLSLFTEKIQLEQVEQANVFEEPWRALYG